MEEKKRRVYSKVVKKIEDAHDIALISHKNPDGDTLWSAVALFEIIHSNLPGKNVDLICVDAPPAKLGFLQHIEKYRSAIHPQKYDLIIFLDSWWKSQTWLDWKFSDLFDKKTFNTINIDHHITNEIYGKQNIIITKYSCTASIIYEIFKLTWWIIPKKAATSLLMWIMFDTGWLKHWNVTPNTYKISADLLRLWGDLQFIVENFYRRNETSTLRLWGKMINKFFVNKDDILYTYVNKNDLESYGATFEDISWVYDYLSMVENIKYIVVLTQKWEYIKWSLRTLRGDVDLSSLAKKFWGWGHKKASWFTTTWKILEEKMINLNIE